MGTIKNELKKFAVVGSGALGTFYGAKLMSQTKQVQFQSKFLSENLKEEALEIKSIWGDFSIKPEVHTSTKTMSPADVIIVATKAVKNIDYPSLLSPLLKKDSQHNTIIVSLQNGINQEEIFAEMFPDARIIGCLAFTCIHRESYKKICHLDYGLLKLAPLKQEDFLIAKVLGKLFHDSGVECMIEKKLRDIRWQKLIWNIPFNPLSVVLGGVTTLDMVNNPEISDLVESLMKEVAKIAHADGVIISDEYIKEMIQKTKDMKPYKTSMFHDYEQGKELEIEAILGRPLQIAQQKHVQTPKMQMLHQLLCYKKNKRKT